MKTFMRSVVLGAFFQVFLALAQASVMVLPGVPDWNQPTLQDLNLPDAGPVGFAGDGSSAAAWCTPSASADLMGYHRDKNPGWSIADNSVFPTTTGRPAVDWRDDMLDTLTVNPPRNDLGWFMNTNDKGDQTVPMIGFNPGGGPVGTHYGNIRPGLQNYLTAHGLNQNSVVNYSDPAGPAALYGTAAIVPVAYQKIVGEINQQRPVLLHLTSYFNASGQVGTLPPLLPSYDLDLWPTTLITTGPGGETIINDIGHTVIVVGYWTGNDSANPYFLSGLGPIDAVIVYDNGDGTFGVNPNAIPRPVVLPFSSGNVNPGLNVPYAMITTVNPVPEPAAFGVVGLLLFAGAIGRRWLGR